MTCRLLLAGCAATLSLAACSDEAPPAPGRQEKEAGVASMAKPGIGVDAAYVARVMGKTGFDLSGCGRDAMAPPTPGVAPAITDRQRQCAHQAMQREDQAIRRQVDADRRNGVVTSATADATLAMERRRVEDALHPPATPGGSGGGGSGQSQGTGQGQGTGSAAGGMGGDAGAGGGGAAGGGGGSGGSGGGGGGGG